ncbi:MAG: hypothetical protein BYD32DRAFT_487471 [Podila humilis]|nr:MAG: hypothetical protein BYD32DRAFT_487471 [Podila humilis]
MPSTSDRKNLIREVEMTILLADNDDDEETLKVFTSDYCRLFAEKYLNIQQKEKPKDIILDDLDVTNILERFRGTAYTADIMEDLKDRPMRLGATYVFSKDFELKWIFDSISKWVDLYHFQPNIFTVGGLIEYFWRIGGGNWGIERTQRRNQQKRSGKKIGRYSYGLLERKIGHQLHDILRSRMAEMDEGKAVSLNTYGFIFRVSLEELPPFYAAVSHSQLRHPSKISVTM